MTASTELELLTAMLGRQRDHVLGILDGLDEEALRRPVLPSGWSCAGLVQHLARDDEFFWFQCVAAGDADAIAQLMDGEAWQLADDVTGAGVLALYREEIQHSDRVLATASLDAEPAWWPDFFGDFRLDTIREVVLHVLTETATHAGHLDAARELIDGRQWLVLD